MTRTVLLTILLMCMQTAAAQRLKRTFFERLLGVDTAFIEPSKYRFQTIEQNISNYESYRIGDKIGNNITFKPSPTLNAGPYIGWGILFVGYSVDVTGNKRSKKNKQLDVSLYTLPFGFDFFWIESGDDYHISRVNTVNNLGLDIIEGKHFKGLKSSIKGGNGYYIFNHHRFSYPAAFNMSTVQRQSSGSAIAGIGYTQHKLSIDWKELGRLTADAIGIEASDELISKLKFENVQYTNISLSGGYGYNWVFAKNWLFAASLSLSIGYKHATSESYDPNILETISDFNIKDVGVDGVGRFGLVWNNGKYFAGSSVKLNTYTYSKKEFRTSSHYGNLNVYAGFNFGLKKKYRKK